MDRPRLGVLFFVFALSFSTPSSFAKQDPFPPRGLFALSEGTKPLPERVLQEKVLAGVSLRAGWSNIEPYEGTFQWATFDDGIERARKAHKKVMLRVDCDHRTPRWVYDAGAQLFDFEKSNPYQTWLKQTHLTIPIPWDPIFLSKWRRFIETFGKKYNDNDTVVLIQMSGPSGAGGEMHLPMAPQDKNHWEQVGYTKDKLVYAWKYVLDSYVEAFPDKPLAINVAQPIYKDGTVEEVLAYGYQKIGNRFCIQHNGLAAKTSDSWIQQRWVVSYKGKAIIGFQLLCPATPAGKFNDNGKRFGGSLAQAFEIGLNSGASYFEIYSQDLKDESLIQVMRDVAEKLK